MKQKISIVIPTLNEARNIKKLLEKIIDVQSDGHEIIIVDGGSTDDTLTITNLYNVKVLKTNKPQRAAQLNMGAFNSSHDILYFIHADVIPPATFIQDILEAIDRSPTFGWFSYLFDSPKAILNFNARFTKFDGWFAGAGDQTLFIQKSLFNQLNGFDESFSIMEDFEFTRRLKKLGIPFHIIPNNCIVSARKYTTNSWLRVNFANLMAIVLFRLKFTPNTIKRLYKHILNPYD